MAKATNLCGELLVINRTERYKLEKLKAAFAHCCPKRFSAIPGKKNS